MRATDAHLPGRTRSRAGKKCNWRSLVHRAARVRHWSAWPSRVAGVCACGTEHVISAMKAAGVRRLVCLTGAMVGELRPNVSFAMRLLAAMFRRKVPHIAADNAEQERLVMASGLDWTIVKPPRLTEGPPTGRVRADAALRVGLLSRISRRDLAAFLLDEVISSPHFQQQVYVSK